MRTNARPTWEAALTGVALLVLFAGCSASSTDAARTGSSRVAMSGDGADGGDPACTTDADCAHTDLCVRGTCLLACRSANDCPTGTTCRLNPSDVGWCYNAPGCNPPPPGAACPTMCWGYCA